VRVAVIGAGLGGLAVAVRLAAAGHEVSVFERNAIVGGKIGRTELGGLGFDTGPSLLTLPYLLEELFEASGGPAERLLLHRSDPLVRYRFADGAELDLPTGSGAEVSAALDAVLGAGAGQDWLGLLDRGRRIWQATYGPVLSSPLGRRGLVRLALRRPGQLGLVAPWRSLHQLGLARLRDPRLRMMLDRYATYSGSDPRRVPAALAAVAWVEADGGGWEVAGGMRRVVEELAARARGLGVELRTGAEVEAVLVHRGAAVGVALANGERVGAGIVVSDVDATQLYGRLVGDRRRRAPLRRLARAGASYSALAVLLAVDAVAAGPPHTVRFPADYTAEFDALTAGRPVEDPAVYHHSAVDGARTAMFVLVNAPPHRPDGGTDWTDPALVAAVTARVLARLQPPGPVLAQAVRTPADLAADTASPGGAIYGSSSNGARAAFLRPANAAPVPGLYLVGGSAHPGGGVPLVLLGARTVARLVGPVGPRSSAASS
jgi:phytoene desaturase